MSASPPASAESSALAADLRAHLVLSEEILAIVSRESQALRGPDEFAAFDFHQQKKNLLPRLNGSLTLLRQHRRAWQESGPTERTRDREVAALLRSNQDLIMKIIVLDRENEQALLRRGLVPARHLPPAQRQRPHYVADLYRRHQN